MTRRFRGVLTIVTTLAAVTVVVRAGDLPLTSIDLRHRVAEELVPMIQPLLEPGEAVVPASGRLLLKAGPATVDNVRELVKQLDRSPHRLRVSVIQDSDLSADELNAGAGVTLQGGPGLPPDVRITGNVYRSTAGRAAGATQEIQTLDGHAAVVQTGSRQPVPNYYGYGYGAVPGIGYEAVSGGIAVTPRLSGDGEVVVDISPWQENFRVDQGGTIEQQSGDTRVRVPLGHWIEIGGQLDTEEVREDGLTGHRYTTRRQAHRIILKVDDLDAAAGR